MDFFNSLSEVAKNRQNFKKWEGQQHDTQAQREELAKRRQHTQAELQQSKKLGETIIDVVDIMDNHSENVAENVETAVDPLSSIATLATFFGGNFLIGKHITNKLLKKKDDLRENFIKNPEVIALADKIREFNQKTTGKDKWFSSWDLTYKNEIERIKDPALKKEAMGFYTKLQKGIKPLKTKMIRNHVGVALATVGAFIVSTIFESKIQTDSSKIARFQARKELEDAKSFVNYTPEQIAAAKKEMAEHPELLKKEKKSKLKSGMIKSIYNVIKDRRAYKKDKSARTDDSQKVIRQLTPEEVNNAKKDQEVIQRTVRVINNEAEKYSENMEVAANVIMGTTPILGATIGAATSWILNKAGVIDKFVDKTVEKYGSENATEVLKKYKEIKKPDFFSRKWFKFVNELWTGKRPTTDNTAEAAFDGIKKVRKKTPTNFTEIVKKSLATGLSHKTGKNWLLGIFGGVIAGFGGMLIALKLQKASARAGRYTAKRELEKDPNNFIGYTEEDFNEVKDVKNNKKKTNKLKEYALFIPTVIKQYWAYNKYKKTEYKEKQIFNDLLKKQEVTDTQLRDAKNLQRKVFNTFEKVDDNSQIYSESMEAATTIAQPFVWYGGILAATSPVIVTGVQIARGKISPAKLTQKLINKLSSGSEIMNKKWFKKYLNNVADNVQTKVQNIEPGSKPIGTILKGIDFQKDSIADIIGKTFKNAQIGVEDFRKLDDKKQMDILYDITYNVERMFDNPMCPIPVKKQTVIKDFLGRLKYGGSIDKMTPDLRADILDMIVNPKSIEKLSEEQNNKIMSIFQYAQCRETIGNLLKFGSVIENSANFVKNGDFTPIINKLNGLITQISHDGLVPMDRQTIEMLEKYLGKENFRKQLGELSVQNIDDFMNPASGILKAGETPKLTGIELDDAKKLVEVALEKTRNTTIKDAIDLLPSKYTNPKEAINEFTSKISKMTDDEFKEFAENIRFRSMDKKTMLEILPKVQKILDNIPKTEVNNIFNKMVKSFQENPDEFIKLVQDGKISSIFLTPGLEKALWAAGISWVAFSVAITWAVETWMADMQLKAGRLGVMKAMDSLKDPAYYANIEPTETANQPIQQQESVTSQSQTVDTPNTITSSSNLLGKFKKVS